MEKALQRYELPPRIGKKPKERIFEIDFLRGFDVFLMVLCHFCYDLGSQGIRDLFIVPSHVPSWVTSLSSFCESVFYSITVPNGWPWAGDLVNTHLFSLECAGAGLFVFLCGVSCAFSKSNFKRGLKLLYVAMGLTLVLYIGTHLGFLNATIIMGILHAMAIALIVYAIYDHFFGEWWQTYAAAIVLAIASGFVVWFGYQRTGYHAGDYFEWNHTLGDYWKILIGTARTGDDYFSPVLVTTGVFLGAVVGKTLYKDRRPLTPDWFPKKWAKPIIWLGKHSLAVYVFHQIVLYLLMCLILLPAGYRLNL
jgi:uncharacterized membrane protein